MPTPEPAGRKLGWRRMGQAVRRSLSRSSSRAASPSPSERERDADTASIKGTSKPSSLRLVDTATLSLPVNGVPSVPSPIAESPAREAAAFASSDMFAAFSEKIHDPATVNGAAFIPAAPADTEQSVITSAPEMTTMPEATTNPSTEIGGPMDSPFIPVQDVQDLLADPAQAASASREESSHPHSELPIPGTVPLVVSDSIENSFSGKNTKDEDSTKPSNRSLDASAELSNGNRGAGYAQSLPNGLISTPTNLQPHAATSPAVGKVNIPEAPQPPAKERYEPIPSMPLSAIQDSMGQNTPSRSGLSAGSAVRPTHSARKPIDGKKSSIPRSARANAGKDESSNWLVIGAVVGAVGVLVFVLARK